MTSTQAYLLDCLINGACIGAWLAVVTTISDDLAAWLRNLRIGSK